MSKTYFFGRPVEAKVKEDYLTKKEEHEKDLDERIAEINRQYQAELNRIEEESRKQTTSSIVAYAMPHLSDLRDEDIDKICNTLKTLKHL